MFSENKKSFPPIPAVLLSMISVGIGASVAKNLFPILGVYGTASLRIGISAIILFVFFRPNLFKLTARQWLYCLGYGLCLGSMNLVFYSAIKRIPIGLGVTIEFTGPLVLALIGSRKKLDLLWVGLAGFGIALLAPRDNNNLDPVGILLAALAGALWAGYIVLGGKVSRIMKGGEVVTVGMLFAALFILPFGIFSGDLFALNWYWVSIGAVVALLSSTIPFTLEIGALKQLPPRTFSILMSLEPALGALSGLIILKEYLSLTQWLSIFCVIVASIGATISSNKENSVEISSEL